jgi:hypothetical protein
MVTVTVALLCACAAILVYDLFSARNSLRNDMDVLAEMLGDNSTAALSFNDPQVAVEILSTLRAKRHIVAADVFAAGGRLLAGYRRLSEPIAAVPAVRTDGAWFQAGRLILFKTITLDGVKIGTIYLESDLEERPSPTENLSRVPGGARNPAPRKVRAWILARVGEASVSYSPKIIPSTKRLPAQS